VSRSRKCGSIHPLLHAPSWRSTWTSLPLLCINREKVGIQNLLIEPEEKGLQLFGHEIGLDKTKIPRRSIELKFKGKGLAG
jgi:hypothetical protein